MLRTALAALALLGISAAGTAGCGKNAHANGKQTMTNQGHTREFWVHVPSGYSKNIPTPVVVLFHGWGYSGKEWYSGSGYGSQSMSPTADKHGFILVAPTGLSDSSLPGNCDNGGGYCSWNGGGTTGSPGPEGPTCATNQQKDNLCYRDTCTDGCKDICWWTTCNDDTTFVHSLLDKIEEEYCVDTSRVYAGGESNGGVMTWQMGTDARAARFAAFFPVIGLPHHGFTYLPSVLPMPIMGVWGSSDNVIPPGAVGTTSTYTKAAGGWFYTTASTITKNWAKAHGCDTDGSPASYPTSVAGLSCKAFSTGCSSATDTAPVVDCRFNGGHVVKDYIPELMWEFFSKHTRTFDSSYSSSNSTGSPTEFA